MNRNVTDGKEWFYTSKLSFIPHAFEIISSLPLRLRLASNDGKSELFIAEFQMERITNEGNKNSLGPLFLLVVQELQRSLQECAQLKQDRANDLNKDPMLISRDIPSPISAINVTVAKRIGSSLINPRVKKQTSKAGKKLAFSDDEEDQD